MRPFGRPRPEGAGRRQRPTPLAPRKGSGRRRLPRPVKRVAGLLLAFFLIEYLVLPRLLSQKGPPKLLTHINLWVVAAGLALEAAALLPHPFLTRGLPSPLGTP